MNKLAHYCSAPNRYRLTSIQGGIVVRGKCSCGEPANPHISMKLSSPKRPESSGLTDQQHVVVSTITRINHQIPIGHRSL